MKKIISSLLSIAVSCSMLLTFAGPVSAAEPEAVSVNPKITGKVNTIRSGRAVISFSISSDAEYGVQYDKDWQEYSGTTASGFDLIQVDFTLSDVVDELFSAVSGAAVIGAGCTVNDKSVTYAFGTSAPYEFAQNDSELFRLNCTLKNAEMTQEELEQYNLVDSFDKLIVNSKVYAVNGISLGSLTADTSYATDGNGDYDTVTAEYIYTAPAPEPAVNAVTINEGDTATVNGGETKQLTATVDAVNGADATVTWSIDPETPATISPDGLFTAPEATEVDQVFTVTATSTFDGSKSDSIEITVPKKEVPQPQQPTTDITANNGTGGVYFDVTMNGNGESITDANVVVAGPTADGEGKEVTFKVINYGDIQGELSFIIGILTDIAGDYTGTSNVTTGVGTATDSATVAFPAAQ